MARAARIALLFAACRAFAVPTQNVLINPGFEAVTSGWQAHGPASFTPASRAKSQEC